MSQDRRNLGALAPGDGPAVGAKRDAGDVSRAPGLEFSVVFGAVLGPPGTAAGGQGNSLSLPITGWVIDITASVIFILIVIFLILLVVRELKLRSARPRTPWSERPQTEAFDQLRMFGDRSYRWPSATAVGTPDPLGIYEFVEIIGRQIVNAGETSLAVAIDAEWGMGKSSAMWMLRQWLEQQGCLTIWFDAWKYRRSDMQRAFISTVIAGVPPTTWSRYLTPGSERLRLIKQTGDLIGKATRLGQVGTLIAAAFGDESYYRNKFEDDFHDVIKTWAEQQKGRRPLVVIFIDDLDRCQPAEVARVLETVKLFFDTPGCIFVFGYDALLVAKSIENDNHGIVRDGLIYLKKLVQFTFRLPQPSPDALRAFLDANIADRRLSSLLSHLHDETDYHALILQGTGGNLRDIKRFLDALVVSAQVIQRQLIDTSSYLALCLLVMLQVRWPRCHHDLERATRMEELRAFIAEIYWYLEQEEKRRAAQRVAWGEYPRASAETPPDAKANLAQSERAREREDDINLRMPWLKGNAELQAFLRRYQLRGLEDDIQRLIRTGLPMVDRAALAEDILAEEDEILFGARGFTPHPYMIPTATGQFTDLGSEFEQVMERLKSAQRGAVVTITGLGGIGKTTLAAIAAERLRDEGLYKDGIAWVVGAGRSDPVEVLRDALGQLMPRGELPDGATIEMFGNLAARWLKDKDVLVVIDGVEPSLPIEQVVATLRTAGATLLLTARQSLDALSSDRIVLTGLSPAEALDLFYSQIGRTPSTLSKSDREAAQRIVSALAFHPLLIRLAAAYAVQRLRSLSALALELSTPQAAGVTAAIQRSTGLLASDAHRLFAACGAFATRDCGQRALVALGNTIGIAQVEAKIEQLVASNLVERYTATDMPNLGDRERLALNPLVREHVIGLLQRAEESEREQVHNALSAYYARYCVDMAAIAPEALDRDAANIQAALVGALERNEDAQVTGIAVGLGLLWNARGNTEESLRLLPRALEAARRVAAQSGHREDELRVADIALIYAQAQRRDGQIEQARKTLEENLAARRELGDRRGEGRVLAQLGLMERLAGHMAEAARYFEQGLAIRQAEGDFAGEAYDLSQLGQIAKTRGHLDEAEQYFTRSLELRRKAGDRAGEADDLGYLGDVGRLRGDTDIAAGFFRQSLEKARAAGYPRAEATAYSHLGQLERVRGNLDQAQDYLEESLKIRRQMRDRRREGFDLGLLGRIEQARGRLDLAEERFTQSLEIAHAVQDIRGIAAVLSSLAQLDLARGNLARAEAYLTKSLPLRDETQDAQGKSVDLSQMGRLYLDRGDFEKAAQYFHESLEIDRASKDLPGEGVDLSQLALVAIEAGRPKDAESYLQSSLPIRRQVHDARGEGVDLSLMGRIAFEREQFQEAETHFQQSLALARQVQNRRGEGVNLRYLGLIAAQRGDLDQAEQWLRTSLDTAEQVQNGLDIADAKRELGRFLIRHRDQRDVGCTLLSEAVRRYHDVGASWWERRAREQAHALGCVV